MTAGESPLENVEVIGDPTLLRPPLLAVLASVVVPPDLVFPALDLAERLRADRISVIGGFQTPLERCLLDILIEGEQRLVICPAQPVDTARLSGVARKAMGQGRLAIVCPSCGFHRPTSTAGAKRNERVVRLASRVMVVHARAGSRTFRTAALAVELGREVHAFDHDRNTDLFLIGAKPFAWRAGIPQTWKSGGAADVHRPHTIEDDYEAGAHVGQHGHPEGGPPE